MLGDGKYPALNQSSKSSISTRAALKCYTTYLGNASQWNLILDELIRNSTQLSDLLLVKDMHPSFWVICIIFCFPDCLPGDFFGEIGVWSQLIIKRWMLTRGLDSIWEDLTINDFLGWRRELVGCCRLGINKGRSHFEEYIKCMSSICMYRNIYMI